MLIQVSGIDPVRVCAKQKGKEENNNNDHHYNNTYKYCIFTPIVSDESRYRSSDRNSSKYSSTFMNFLLIQVMLLFGWFQHFLGFPIYFLLVVVVVVGFVFIAVKFQSCYIFILSCRLCPRFVFVKVQDFPYLLQKQKISFSFFYFSAFMKIEIQDILFILFRFCFQLRTLNTRTHILLCSFLFTSFIGFPLFI